MDAIGIHAVFGGFLLGACMPKGALVEKIRETLQPCVVVFFLSMFLTFSGLKTDLGVVLQPQLLVAAVVILVVSFA